MAVYAVIADVHGNGRALDAVLEQLDQAGVRDVVCLGDLVGYCAQPNECVTTADARGFDAIAGNHELIALEVLDTRRCGLAPAHALTRTRQTLDDASRRFLASLPPFLRRGEVLFVHGSIDDPCEYMSNEESIAQNAPLLASRHVGARVCFFGHTHVPRVYELRNGSIVHHEPRAELRLVHPSVWFINPGAVDGSRAPERVARFAIVDDAAPSVSFRTALYEHEAVEREARRQGYRLPRSKIAWHALQDGVAKLASRRSLGKWR
jgi:predicted phosphodiesterase